jgi:hypothetical protein
MTTNEWLRLVVLPLLNLLFGLAMIEAAHRVFMIIFDN